MASGGDDSAAIEDVALKLAAADLAAQMCDAIIRFDVDAFASCWSSDATWSAAGMFSVSGRQHIGALFADRRAGYVLCTQELTSGLVRPVSGSGAGSGAGPATGRDAGRDAGTGTVAQARWFVRELQWPRDAPPRCIIGAATDALVYDDGDLRIGSRHYVLMYQGPPDLAAAPNAFTLAPFGDQHAEATVR